MQEFIASAFGLAGLVGVFLGVMLSVIEEDVANIESRCPYNDFWALTRNPFA